MKKSIGLLIGIVFLLNFSNHVVYGQSPTPTNSTESEISTNNFKNDKSQYSEDNLLIEIEVLKGQLDLMRQYDQRLLNTVYWSLGVVLILGSLLIGFNFFSNYKYYEKEKKAIKDELNLELLRLFNDYSNQKSKDFEQNKIQLSHDLEKNSKQLSEKISQDVTDIDAKIDKLNVEINEKIMNINVVILENEAENLFTNRIFTTAISEYIQLITILLSFNKNSYRINRSLERILESIKQLKKNCLF